MNCLIRGMCGHICDRLNISRSDFQNNMAVSMIFKMCICVLRLVFVTIPSPKPSRSMGLKPASNKPSENQSLSLSIYDLVTVYDGSSTSESGSSPPRKTWFPNINLSPFKKNQKIFIWNAQSTANGHNYEIKTQVTKWKIKHKSTNGTQVTKWKIKQVNKWNNLILLALSLSLSVCLSLSLCLA